MAWTLCEQVRLFAGAALLVGHVGAETLGGAPFLRDGAVVLEVRGANTTSVNARLFHAMGVLSVGAACARGVSTTGSPCAGRSASRPDGYFHDARCAVEVDDAAFLPRLRTALELAAPEARRRRAAAAAARRVAASATRRAP